MGIGMRTFVVISFSVILLSGILGIGQQAFATIEGDTVHVIIKDAVGAIIDEFDLVDIPTGAGAGKTWLFADPIFARMAVTGDGFISLSYDNRGVDPFSFDAHTIWIEDIDWTDSPGKISHVETLLENAGASTVTNTDDSVHIDIDAFSLLPNDPISISTQNIYEIFAEHFVGGEMIPLDTSALILAGAQMNSAWILPVIVSGIGIAIVIARKF